MKFTIIRCTRFAPVALLSLGFQAAALATQIDVTYVGTWTGPTNPANATGAGGPGMATGQRYVVKASYDDASTVNTTAVRTEAGAASGQTMSTVDLGAAGNSLQILVPMEGFDAGTPFVYTQTQANHFPAFVASPTLNFKDGTSIGDTGNIIGLEFEGDFVVGAGNNVVEVFNTAANAAAPINQVSQIINFGTGTAIRGINALATAVDVVADAGSDIVYSAPPSERSQTTDSNSVNNDLGAFRSDGEDFIQASWSESGNPLVGVTSGNDITVAIENSGLTSTVDTTGFSVTLTEDLTGKSGTDTVGVSYLNALPTIDNVSALVQASGLLFELGFSDVDLAVNSLIAGFEELSVEILVDLVDKTAFFADLINNGSQAVLQSLLLSEFGVGTHTFKANLSDRAILADSQLMAVMSSFDFEVVSNGGGAPATEPATLALFGLGAVGLAGFARRRHELVA